MDHHDIKYYEIEQILYFFYTGENLREIPDFKNLSVTELAAGVQERGGGEGAYEAIVAPELLNHLSREQAIQFIVAFLPMSRTGISFGIRPETGFPLEEADLETYRVEIADTPDGRQLYKIFEKEVVILPEGWDRYKKESVIQLWAEGLGLEDGSSLFEALPEALQSQEGLHRYFEEGRFVDFDHGLMSLGAIAATQAQDTLDYLRWQSRIMAAYPALRGPYLRAIETVYPLDDFRQVYQLAKGALEITGPGSDYEGEAACFETAVLHDYLMIAATRLESYEEALEQAKVCLELEPDNERYQKNLEWLQVRKLQTSESEEELVSIIILCHNQLDYTIGCLDSIREHTPQNHELILVDNGSTDGTREWLGARGGLTVIRNEANLGFPKGCNQGLEAVRGEYILFLNNDVVVTANWLENLLGALRSSPKVGAVGPLTNHAGYGTAIEVPYQNMNQMHDFAAAFNRRDPSLWEERQMLVGFCLLVKKEALDAAGSLLDERFTPGNFEDNDLCLRLFGAGYKLYLCRDTFVHHFGSISWRHDDPGAHDRLLEANRQKFDQKWGLAPDDQLLNTQALEALAEYGHLEGNILELGSGTGVTLLALKQKFPHLNFFGLEPNVEAARLASRVVPVAGIEFEDLLSVYGKLQFKHIIFSKTVPVEKFPALYEAAVQLLVPGGNAILSARNWEHYHVYTTRQKRILVTAWVDHEACWAQCQNQIQRLEVPPGHEVVMYPIRQFATRAEAFDHIKGYPAKYKVYLDQGTFLTNPNVLTELINLFESNEKLGLIGAAGAKRLPKSGDWRAGETLGQSLGLAHGTYSFTDYGPAHGEEGYTSVAAVDGRFMATQYDLPWRNIYQGSFFDDITHSLEFLKAGYVAGVANNAYSWCFHYGEGPSTDHLEADRKVFQEQYLK